MWYTNMAYLPEKGGMMDEQVYPELIHAGRNISPPLRLSEHPELYR